MALSREQTKKLSDAAAVENPEAKRISCELHNWIYKNVHFVWAQNLLLACTTSTVPKHVVVFTGIRRTQKSKVVEAVCGILDERARDAGKRLGSLLISTPPFDRIGGLDWKEAGKDIYLPIMGSLANQVVPIPPLEQGALHIREAKHKKASEAAYLSAIANDMNAEGIPLIVDHAHIVFRLSSPNRIKLFFAALARLVDKGEQPVVLVGNPGLALLCESASDVNIEFVQMPCYRTDVEGITEIAKLLDSFEKKVGAKFCEEGVIKNRASEITSLADGHLGVIVDALKAAFEDDCVWGHGMLTWTSVKRKLKAARASSGEFMAEREDFERRVKVDERFVVWSFPDEPQLEGNIASKDVGDVSDSALAAETKTPIDTDNNGHSVGDPQPPDTSGESSAGQPKRRRRRRARFGRTKQTNRPLHPYGDPDAED